MNWYERTILPGLIHRVMRDRRFRPYRERSVAAARGRVLEVGIGSGLNLPHYGPDVQHIVGIDPSMRLLQRAARAATPGGPPLELHAVGAAHLPFPAASFDSVVFTWTLCSIPEPEVALAELRRVLKPGGRLCFVEHGRAPQPGVQAWQRRLTPLWRHVSGGCHLDRAMDALIRDAGFELTHLEAGYAPGPRPFTFMYEGIAIAPGAPVERGAEP